MYSVLLMTVFWDNLGVLIGMFIANLVTEFDNTSSIRQYRSRQSTDQTQQLNETMISTKKSRSINQCHGGVISSLRGPLSFGAAKGISDRMSLVENYKVLV